MHSRVTVAALFIVRRLLFDFAITAIMFLVKYMLNPDTVAVHSSRLVPLYSSLLQVTERYHPARCIGVYMLTSFMGALWGTPALQFVLLSAALAIQFVLKHAEDWTGSRGGDAAESWAYGVWPLRWPPSDRTRCETTGIMLTCILVPWYYAILHFTGRAGVLFAKQMYMETCSQSPEPCLVSSPSIPGSTYKFIAAAQLFSSHGCAFFTQCA